MYAVLFILCSLYSDVLSVKSEGFGEGSGEHEKLIQLNRTTENEFKYQQIMDVLNHLKNLTTLEAKFLNNGLDISTDEDLKNDPSVVYRSNENKLDRNVHITLRKVMENRTKKENGIKERLKANQPKIDELLNKMQQRLTNSKPKRLKTV